MGDTLSARLEFLQRQLHAIGLAIDQARARDDVAGLKRLHDTFHEVLTQVLALQEEVKASEMPSQFLMQLDNLSDEAIATGKKLEAAAVQTAQGAASLVRWLPVVLLVAIVVVGIYYVRKVRT